MAPRIFFGRVRFAVRVVHGMPATGRDQRRYGQRRKVTNGVVSFARLTGTYVVLCTTLGYVVGEGGGTAMIRAAAFPLRSPSVPVRNNGGDPTPRSVCTYPRAHARR